MDHRQGGLVLVVAGAGSCVLRGAEQSAGDDQVRGATRPESAEVSGSAVAQQVVVSGRPRAERDQVPGGDGRVAAVRSGELPGDRLAAERVLAHFGLTGGQREGGALGDDRVTVEHARPVVTAAEFFPDHLPVLAPIGGHPGVRLVAGTVAIGTAGLQQDVVPGRVVQKGAEDVPAGAPDLLAGADVQCQQSRFVIGQFFGVLAATFQGVLLPARECVDAKDLAGAQGDVVVAEVVLRIAGPKDLAALAVHHDQAFAGRGISRRREAFLGHADRRRSGRQHVLPNADVAPSRGRSAAGGRHGELAQRLSGGRVEPEDLFAVDHVHGVRQGDVVAADLAGARLVAGVVEKLAEPLEFLLPQQPAGVDVQRADHVGTFDEQPPGGHLRRGAMSVTRKDLVVGRTVAEPQQTQRGLHQGVLRDHAGAGVGVMMGPIGGAGQCARPQQHRPALAGRPDLGARQPGRLGQAAEFPRVAAQTGRAAVGPQHAEDLPDKRHAPTGSRRAEILRKDQTGQVRRQGIGRRVAHMRREPSAVPARVRHAAAEGVDLLRVRVDDDQVQLRRPDQLFGQLAAAQSEHHTIALRLSGNFHHRGGQGTELRIGLRIGFLVLGQGGKGVGFRLAPLGSEAVDSPGGGHHEQFAVGGQHVPGFALEGSLPAAHDDLPI